MATASSQRLVPAELLAHRPAPDTRDKGWRCSIEAEWIWSFGTMALPAEAAPGSAGSEEFPFKQADKEWEADSRSRQNRQDGSDW